MRHLITLALIALATPAHASTSLADWWRASFGYAMPSTVQPEPYSAELSARGIGCQTAARQPEWAMAEAIGRAVLARYRERGTLPGQSIGTWAEDVESAHNNGPMRFMACQIANRGVAGDTAFMVTHGARSFPNDALRLLAGLAPAGGDTEQARREGAAAMKARALAAVGGL